jgi:decaprenylphospho-beta-D-ribofuranose 2-oxidase
MGPRDAAYGFAQACSSPERTISLYEFLFPVARKVLYFRLFGRAGFHEYQVLVPRENFAEFVRGARRRLERARTAIALFSCKLFRGTQGLLRFDGSGVCLALDFPRGPAGSEFAAALDDLTRALGGIPNIGKDSRLPKRVVQECYPEYEEFASRVRTFDPRRIYRSEISERLGI